MAEISEVLFADVKMKALEEEKSLPFKFKRMIEKSNIPSLVKGKKVCIKMHLGGKTGYTTIHPMFVRILVKEIKDAGAKSVFIADGSKKGCEARGYTRKSVGCKIKSLFGWPKMVKKFHVGFKKMDDIEISSKVLNSDVLIVFSHVKGHGDAGFGGAGKNIAMGCVPSTSRGKMHALEGSIEWDESKCKHCNKCIEECPNKANKFNDQNKYEVFWHNCKYCRHCVLICPYGALKSTDVTFEDFQRGMALLNKIIIEKFKQNIYFISVLMNITVYCDCWGFSSPSLVPDIGILASHDIVAIDRATLDMIKTEDIIQKNGELLGLPEGRKLGTGNHLFEKIHGKDPYLMSEYLAEYKLGSKNYKIITIE